MSMNRYLSFAREEEYGTAVPAVDFLDPESCDLDPPADTVMVYPGASGYDRIAKAGRYIPAGSFSIPFDLKVAPFWLAMGLGEVETSGGGGPAFASTLDGVHIAGSTVLTVADSTGAAPGQVVTIGSGGTQETKTIDTVDSGTQVTLTSGLTNEQPDGAAITTSAGSFTHILTARRVQTLPSATVRVGKDLFEHIFTGACVDTLEFNASDEFATLDVSLLAQKDSRGDLEEEVAFTDGDVYAPYEMGVTLAGVDRTALVRSVALSIENGADAEMGVTFGSRFPRRVYQGAFSAELEVELAFTDTDDMDRFWGAVGGPIDAGDIEIFDVSLSVGPDITFSIPRAIYTAMQQPLAGRDPVEQTGTIRALFDEVSQTVFTASVTNDRESY